MTKGRFADRIAADREIIERLAVKTLGDTPLEQAMHYALSGGKMLRGFLVLETARLHDIAQERAQYAALAIECIHAYSLVHDDLPCMDDDDLRRGQPTVHRKWNEAMAVLAGDALQTLAFELLCQDTLGIKLVAGLAKASGRHGMVHGQMLDIAAETAEEPLTLEAITELQQGKTGALLLWSSTAGAVMAEADTTALETYGRNIGLAFQIADDLLDVEGDAATVGKATGKDADAGKATFVSLLGLEAARQRADDLIQEACDALAPYGAAGETLCAAARFITSRDR